MENTKIPQASLLNTQPLTGNTPPAVSSVPVPEVPTVSSEGTPSGAAFQPEPVETPHVEETPKIQHTQQDMSAGTTHSSSMLLEALYWIWDGFERSMLPFFLVGQTVEDVIAGRELTGSKIELGVRRNEWISGGRRILDSFVTPRDETPELITYTHNNGVDVLVKVYEDHECIIQTDTVMYRHELFKVPNPLSKFKEVFEQQQS